MLFLSFLKRNIKRRPNLYYRLTTFYYYLHPICGRNNKINNRGTLLKCKFSIIGHNNQITIASGCVLKNVEFHIRGNNHIIDIDESCRIIEKTSLWCEGENNSIIIGAETSIYSAHICVQEKNNIVSIGGDCMLSNNILIRTSDSHPIYDNATGKRINEASSVFINAHVWICAKASIMKGVTIGQGSVIGYGTLVTKNVPPEVLFVGIPGKVVKQNIYWDRTFKQKG